LINDIPCKSTAQQIDPLYDVVKFDGEIIVYSQYLYIVLNKPKGYVSATEDIREKTVLDLLPEKLRSRGLFPCGRLDKNTVGLMLLTNNGDLGHKLLSPKYHVEKTYRFQSLNILSDDDKQRLENGVSILDGYITKKASVAVEEDGKSGTITITEGKYHQIKLMFEAVGNKILELERITFGPLNLDVAPPRGEWRYLTAEEVEKLENHCK
jgi:16S rRNA pseudouridine516 synthase